MSGTGLSAKGEARRAEILETALRVLAERGYRDTSLRAIGRELGVQPAQLLHYFASREALLEAVISGWDRMVSDPPDETGGFLEHWLGTVQRNAAIPGLVHLYTALAAEAANPNHPSHSYIAERYRAVRELVEQDLAAGIRAGRYTTDLPPKQIAAILVSLSDGLQLQWLIDPAIDMPGELQAAMTRLTGHPFDVWSTLGERPEAVSIESTD